MFDEVDAISVLVMSGKRWDSTSIRSEDCKGIEIGYGCVGWPVIATRWDSAGFAAFFSPANIVHNFALSGVRASTNMK